jgi:cysteine-rich repeat protein
MHNLIKKLGIIYFFVVLSISLILISSTLLLNPASALVSACGNKKVDQGEICDDGNRKNGDQCSYDCKNRCSGTTIWNNKHRKCVNVCGNNRIDIGAKEKCDDGNRNNYDTCSSNCKKMCVGNLVWNGVECIPTSSLSLLQPKWIGKEYKGIGESQAYSLVSDSNGNVYVSGVFNSIVDFGSGDYTSIDPEHGAAEIKEYDYFVVKYNTEGIYQWAIHIVDDLGYTGSHDIAIDNEGNIYVTGFFSNYIKFTETNSLTATSGSDYFVAKYTSSGVFQWARQEQGGTGSVYATSVSTDSNGDVIVGGYFRGSVDFGAGMWSTASEGAYNYFIIKYDSLGNYLWADSQDGGIGNSFAYSIDVDLSRNIYLVGHFKTNPVDFGAGNWSPTGMDYFIIKYTKDGNFLWADREDSGNASVSANDVEVDSEGNVYVVGAFEATNSYPKTNPVINFGTGDWVPLGSDYFIVKYTPEGTISWTDHKNGGKGDAYISDVAVDSKGNIYVVGSFEGTVDFGIGKWVSSDLDYFVLKYTKEGRIQRGGKEKGGIGSSRATSANIDVNDSLYVAGYFYGEGVDLGFGAVIPSVYDYFVLKY